MGTPYFSRFLWQTPCSSLLTSPIAPCPSPIAPCLWPGLYTKEVYFSPNRAIPCTSCNLASKGIIENPHYSRAKGIWRGRVAAQDGGQNLTYRGRHKARKVHFRCEQGGNVRVSFRLK